MGSPGITRRELLKAGLLLGATAGVAAAFEFWGVPTGGIQDATKRSVDLPWDRARQIAAETTTPRFPDAVFMVTDRRYGAVGDGKTNSTAAFSTAIEECSASGGGHVVVPAGVYSTGAIELRSHVDLHLEPGAVLRFHGDPEEFPLVLTRYEGIECFNRSPMIYAYEQTDLALTGGGVLDASLTGAWNTGGERARVLEPLVGAGLPPEQRIVPHHGRLRSAFIEPYRCANVLIAGVTLRHSQFWQLHPTLCRNVTVDSVTTGDTNNANSDGCNPESCDHVVIKNCTLSAFDDCVAIKSGRDTDGRRINTPCQNIVIRGCRLQGPAGGIAFGSEMTGGIRDVYIHDVKTYGRSVRHMLYFKSNTRRGGYAEGVHIDGARADHLAGAWAFAQMDYDGQNGDFRPIFKDWTISNSSGDFDPWVLELRGLGDDPIGPIHVSDSSFTDILVPIDFNSNVRGLTFDRVTINGRCVSG
jgi:polygalacturonase